MEAEAWIIKLSLAYKKLLSEVHCDGALNDHLEESDAHFVWLDEIAEEAFKIFAVKCTKLEQMPKTPSMKQRGKKRAKQKIDVINENDSQQQGSPATAKMLPTKLKFESPKETADAEESFVNECGRPVRNCRVRSKAVYVDENEVPKRSTRQSKKPNNKIQHSTMSDKDALGEVEACMKEKPAPNSAKAKTYTPTVAKVRSEEKSPSVRERAIAYESMLKQQINKSPAKRQRTETPTSTNKTGRATKVGTPMREITNAKNSTNQMSTGNRTFQSPLPSDSQSMKQRSSISKKSKLASEESGARVRTRLRLNKQKQQEQNLDTSKSEQSTAPEASIALTDKVKKPCLNDEQTRDAQKFDGVNHGDRSVQQDPRDILNETETVITEVYEIQGKGQPAKLKEFEVVRTKTTPVCNMNRLQVTEVPTYSGDDHPASASDQGFNDDDEESADESSFDSVGDNKDREVKMNKEVEPAARTRTRAKKENEESIDSVSNSKPSKDSGVSESAKANLTFVKMETSVEVDIRPARTRARAQKEVCAEETSAESTGPAARTRQRKQDGASSVSQDSKHTSAAVMEGNRVTAQRDSPAVTASDERTGPSTRTRQRKQDGAPSSSQDLKNTRTAPVETQPSTRELTSGAQPRQKPNGRNKLAMYGSDDEIVASSPVMSPQKSTLRMGKKRFAEERGMSPRPKRSCLADHSCLSPPQSTISPIKLRGGYHNEEMDRVVSPRQSPRPFKFNSAQKKTSGFLNRTPGFGQNTSRLYSFLNSTPYYNSSGVLTSFLKRNTPPPKQTIQVLQEQKRQKLLEKENRDKERLKKALELRKRKIEDQKRLRAEKEQKVAEAREMKLRTELEQKEKINKKFEDKATVKEKLIEERCKEEREKQRQRLKKQMEADARRKIEEEERLKKLLEQEEEAKMHEEFMQRKREFEEMERRRQIAEEKRKQEERLAELEHKRQEEKLRLKQLEEERERERDWVRQEREKQIAYEKAERERVEREKREEKERKIQEEQEKLKAMERERLLRQQEKMKLEEAQQNAIKLMIHKHNTTLSKQPSTVSTLQTPCNTNNYKINSYEITPVKEKIISKSKNSDNYDIEDHGSDDSTDDDQAPKKKIPKWAMGICLETALIKQDFNPPDFEALFGVSRIEPPNLNLIFPRKIRSRFNKRTSSAVWKSPPLKQ